MLQSLLPKAHARMLALLLLGPIVDGFDDWLAANGYAVGSRKYAIRMLPHVDNDLRKTKSADGRKVESRDASCQLAASDQALSDERWNGPFVGVLPDGHRQDRC